MTKTPKLVDVTNLNQLKNRRNSMAQEKYMMLGNNTLVSQENTKDSSKLLAENAYLLKLLREKNEIIHRSNLDLQKFQFQNTQLVKANAHMLAELKRGKEKNILLDHELKCTRAMLKEKNLHLKANRTSHKTEGAKELNSNSLIEPVCLGNPNPNTTIIEEIKKQELPEATRRQPSRRATIGVCYKEASVNIKMRRE
ncbi:hypothetical protein ZOSMA_34G00270 [Zostera marina]|uniref:Shugoshin C-terminal domain-containing protein n=1 Tax=Zostera marina TaxID=29655 RepID=A0A0K9P9A5_ZOSMR|nr:hypothetical protein ZOSMA_34G00270 [Zostera marina]